MILGLQTENYKIHNFGSGNIKTGTHLPLVGLSNVSLSTVGIYKYGFTCSLPFKNLQNRYEIYN